MTPMKTPLNSRGSVVWSPSQASAWRREKRRATYYSSINLWGFASVMLALVFTVIGDTTPDRNQGPPVDLPHAANCVLEPSALRDDAISVSITRDGLIYFDRKRIRPELLTSLIQKAMHDGAERKIYLAADSRINFRTVSEVLNQIRKAGIMNVVILVHKRIYPAN